MQNTKYTNETFDELIKNRSLIRLGNYTGIKNKIDFKCTKCNYIWNVSPNSIINAKTNCPQCFGNVKLTNEDIDNKLCKNIIRIDNIINGYTKINFKCLKCNSLFLNSPSRAIKKKQCSTCSNKILLTDEIIDKRLINRNVKRISGYIVGEKIEFQCLTCNKNWKSTANKVLNRNRGCHHCANSIRYSNDSVDKLLINKNIKRIGEIFNSKIKCKFKCLVCDNIWETVPSSLTTVGCGCPDCSIRKNEKLFKSVLDLNSIEYQHNFKIKNIDSSITNNFNVDFYIQNKNIILEYNGDQHYRPVKFGGIPIEDAEENFNHQQFRDSCIEWFCNKNNIKLIWIDGRKYKDKKLEQYIKNELIPTLT